MHLLNAERVVEVVVEGVGERVLHQMVAYVVVRVEVEH